MQSGDLEIKGRAFVGMGGSELGLRILLVVADLTPSVRKGGIGREPTVELRGDELGIGGLGADRKSCHFNLHAIQHRVDDMDIAFFSISLLLGRKSQLPFRKFGVGEDMGGDFLPIRSEERIHILLRQDIKIAIGHEPDVNTIRRRLGIGRLHVAKFENVRCDHGLSDQLLDRIVHTSQPLDDFLLPLGGKPIGHRWRWQLRPIACAHQDPLVPEFPVEAVLSIDVHRPRQSLRTTRSKAKLIKTSIGGIAAAQRPMDSCFRAFAIK